MNVFRSCVCVNSNATWLHVSKSQASSSYSENLIQRILITNYSTYTDKSLFFLALDLYQQICSYYQL